MKLTFVFLIIALFSPLLAQEETSEASSLISNLESTEFGQNLINTIGLQMGSEGADSINKIIALLQKLEHDYDSDQCEDDQATQKTNLDCDETLDRLKSGINLSASKIEECKQDIQDRTPILQEKQRLLKDLQDNRAAMLERIANKAKENDDRNKEWQKDQADHDKAQFAIESAKNILQGNLQEVKNDRKKYSLAQTNQRNDIMSQVSQEFSYTANEELFQRKSWNYYFQVLADITLDMPIQANQQQVQRIIELCDELLNKIMDSRDMERKDFANWTKMYQDYTSQAQKDVKSMDDAVDLLSYQINHIQGKIQQLTQEKREQKQRKLDFETEYKEKNTFCADIGLQYSQRRTQRQDERLLISKAIQLIQGSYRQLRDYIKKKNQ